MMTFKQFFYESKYPLLRKPLEGEPGYYSLIGYRATSLEYWSSIKSRGLIPGKSKPPGQTWDGTWSGKAIYYHLAFPYHEIDNSYDTETGEPFSLVIEAQLNLPAGYFVPDEESSSNVDDTEQVITNKGTIAVGYIEPPSQFLKIHMIDTIPARKLASINVKRWPVEFHKPEL